MSQKNCFSFLGKISEVDSSLKKIIHFKREISVRVILGLVDEDSLFATSSRKVLKAILRESNNITCLAMGITNRKTAHSLSTIQSHDHF